MEGDGWFLQDGQLIFYCTCFEVVDVKKNRGGTAVVSRFERNFQASPAVP
jgi:hypothetical protein